MGKKIEIDSDELRAIIRRVASDFTFYDWSIATRVINEILQDDKNSNKLERYICHES